MEESEYISPIATSIEQSKRLLAAGIDPRSCDMRWTNEVEKDEGWGFIITEEEEEYHLELGQPFFDFPSDPSIPAWSLSRQWDIIGGGVLMFPRPSNSSDFISSLVAAMIHRADNGAIAKKILEMTLTWKIRKE